MANKLLRSTSGSPCTQTSATSASRCFKNVNSLQDLDRQRFLLRYVQNVQPEVMEDFVRHAPAHVSHRKHNRNML